MALKATINKATLEISDLDRQVYQTHSIVIAQHPSENNERMMVRLLAFALNVPSDDTRGPLEFAKDMWEPDEPALWQRDLTGKMFHWIEVGQPEERRITRACGRSEKVSVYSFGTSTWWAGIKNKLTRCENLNVWQIPPADAEALTSLTERTMILQVTVQDGAVYVGDGTRSIEVTPERLYGE
jgi:uncharacterized protein YaeQ